MKTEQIREEFEKEFQYLRASSQNDTGMRVIADWWLQKLAEQRQEILAFTGKNERKAYQRGYDEAKLEIIRKK